MKKNGIRKEVGWMGARMEQWVGCVNGFLKSFPATRASVRAEYEVPSCEISESLKDVLVIKKK